MKLFPPDTILVPTDLSSTSLDALGFARLFHETFGSRIIVLHAEQLEAPPYFTSAQTDALLEASREAREQAVDEVRRAVATRLGFAPDTRVVEGVPSETIVSFCESERTDLVVLGTHGRRGVSRLWLGSVTERVLRTSRCPVLGGSAARRERRHQHHLLPRWLRRSFGRGPSLCGFHGGEPDRPPARSSCRRKSGNTARLSRRE